MLSIVRLIPLMHDIALGAGPMLNRANAGKQSQIGILLSWHVMLLYISISWAKIICLMALTLKQGYV